MSKANRKILIIATFTGIGDFFLCLPMLASLSDHYGVKPDILVRRKARFHDFLGKTGLFRKILIYDKEGYHRSPVRQAALLLKLRRQRYDIGLTLHPGKRYVILLWLIGAGIRVGGSENPVFHRLLTHSIPDRKFDPDFYTAFHGAMVHGLDCFYYFLDRLGITYTRRKPDLSIGDSVQEKAAAMAGSLGNPVVGINPGSSGDLKNWPEDKFIRLITKIKERFPGAGFILFGGPDEENRFRKLKQSSPDSIYAMGKDFDLVMNTALLKECELLISNDTGLVHVASFFDIPVISIGGARDGKAFLAWSSCCENLLEPVFCNRICTSCTHFNCVQKIKVTTVLESFENMMNRIRSAQKDRPESTAPRQAP